MTPRPALADDAQRLAEVHAQAYARPWPAEDFAALLAQDGVFALVVGEPLQAFVFCRVAAGEGEILMLATAPDARRRGLGLGLSRSAMAEAARLGAGALFLEVADDNPAALALYRSAGFETAGVRRAYYPTPRGFVDALTLRCELNTAAP